MSHARYIGDGVYAQFDGYGVLLTTSSHIPADADNQIALEPEVIRSLKKYFTDLEAALAANPTERPEQI